MKYSARDLCIGGLFSALGAVLPVLFHLIGQGAVFLPMHLPVLICGLLVSPVVAFAVGVMTPFVSSAVTGMPPMIPMALFMAVELGVLAAAAGIAYRRLRLPVIIAVIMAIILARIAGGLVRAAVAPFMNMEVSAAAYLLASVVTGWPGILLQLVTVPAFISAVERISRAYSQTLDK